MKKPFFTLASHFIMGIVFFGTIGCDKKSDCCTIIDTEVQILYVNKSGENLINSNPDYDASKIKVYFKNGNEYEYINKGNLDSPHSYHIDEDEKGNLILTIYPSNYYEGNQSTTLIALHQNVVDTLLCEFELDSNREILKKSWLNGIEMENRFIKIEK